MGNNPSDKKKYEDNNVTTPQNQRNKSIKEFIIFGKQETVKEILGYISKDSNSTQNFNPGQALKKFIGLDVVKIEYINDEDHQYKAVLFALKYKDAQEILRFSKILKDLKCEQRKTIIQDYVDYDLDENNYNDQYKKFLKRFDELEQCDLEKQDKIEKKEEKLEITIRNILLKSNSTSISSQLNLDRQSVQATDQWLCTPIQLIN